MGMPQEATSDFLDEKYGYTSTLPERIEEHSETTDPPRIRWFKRRDRQRIKDSYGRDVETGQTKEYEYKNAYGRKFKKKLPAVESYLSSSRAEPRKLIVQASTEAGRNLVEDHADWHRRSLTGSVPTAFRLSEWTLRPAFEKSRRDGHRINRIKWLGIPLFLLRTFLVSLPLQVYMSLPMFTPPWEEDEANAHYQEWLGWYGKWPKFAVNRLDMSPDAPGYHLPEHSSKARLHRPRRLMVLEDGRWVRKDLECEPAAWRPYVLISFANDQWRVRGGQGEEGRAKIRRIAALQAERAGVRAYWNDFDCSASEKGELLTSDINRYCDVVRSASRVVIALPDESLDEALIWGKKMWTLTEALLAPVGKLYAHYADSDRDEELSKTQVAGRMWSATNAPVQHTQEVRLLAEHYSGTLHLSRLQLMSTAMAALWDRRPEHEHDQAELAHCLMGLLHTRMDPVKGNTLFQDIAKLSLLNDCDLLVERMLCLLPVEGTNNLKNPLKMLYEQDAFGTRLWDIHPTCEVVGVDSENHTVILNETRAIHIGWKQFPRMLYKRQPGLKKRLAEIFLRSGVLWYISSIKLLVAYAPLWIGNDETPNTPESLGDVFKWLAYAVALVFGIGALLSLAGPISIRVLYGGNVMSPAPHLVGFEGTMPIHRIEEVVFGNDESRLTYGPSSTPFCEASRHPTDRVCMEPDWVAHPNRAHHPKLQTNHRLFTLVDTGSMSVSIFQAERPPTVALICGREGGMLRTVLCSWKPDTDCLYRESVMRMPTDVYALATPKGWLRLQLGREK